MNKIIVHIRRSIPGVSDTFVSEREFSSRDAANAFIEFNEGDLARARPHPGLYGTIVN